GGYSILKCLAENDLGKLSPATFGLLRNLREIDYPRKGAQPMPFQGPPWRDYKLGDLLYGLQGPRSSLREYLGIDEKALHCIDQLAIGWAEEHTASSLKYDDTFCQALQTLDTKHKFNWNAEELANLWNTKKLISGHEGEGEQQVKAYAIAKK